MASNVTVILEEIRPVNPMESAALNTTYCCARICGSAFGQAATVSWLSARRPVQHVAR
jgi:hypothetical protein